jgi:pimeloyl-ACP methyl ester carboxylesterase
MPEIAAPADNLLLRYEVAGTGDPTLVFIHGWSCDRGYWTNQLDEFSRRFKVVAVDLAGHGESGLDRVEWTIEALGRDVAAVVQHIGLERVIFVGHSMGSDVALEAARHLSGKVDGLIFVDQYSSFDRVISDEEIAKLLTQFEPDFVTMTDRFVRAMFSPGTSEALIERVASDMASAPPNVALPLLSASKRYVRQVAIAIAQTKVSAIAINAAHPASDIESLKRGGVEVVLMPDIGHFLMMERPTEFNRLLLAVIERLVARRS